MGNCDVIKGPSDLSLGAVARENAGRISWTPFPYIRHFIAQYADGNMSTSDHAHDSRDQKTKMSIISDVYHFNHYFFVLSFADLYFRVIRRVADFFSLASLLYAQL